MEELEESVWSVVQQKSEREDQGECVSGKTDRDNGNEMAQEKKIEVTEMRMLRCMCRVTKLDEIRNERITMTRNVGEIAKNVQEEGWSGMGM